MSCAKQLVNERYFLCLSCGSVLHSEILYVRGHRLGTDANFLLEALCVCVCVYKSKNAYCNMELNTEKAACSFGLASALLGCLPYLNLKQIPTRSSLVAFYLIVNVLSLLHASIKKKKKVNLFILMLS